MRASISLISKTSPGLSATVCVFPSAPTTVLPINCAPHSSTITVFGSRRSSMRPCESSAGAPAKVSASMPTNVINLKFPSTMRACKNEVCNGAAHATPSTERTRPSSVSRIGFASFACSTMGSLTQTWARIFTTGVYVQLMMPKKTEVCCAINKAENAKPQRSIANLARSPKSMFKARRNIKS